jgi:hypothetical protein
MQRSTISGPEGGATPTHSAGAHRNILPRPALYRRRARQTTKNIPIEPCTACPRVLWLSQVAADRARTGELAIPSGFRGR